MPPPARVAGAERLRASTIDQARAAGEVALVEHLLGRAAHVAARIGDVRVDVGEGELHRLDLQVLRLGAVDRQRLEVELAQDAERDQRSDALAVRRDLVQAVAVRIDADRLDPLGRERGQVARLHRAAVRARVGGNRSGDLALVEGGAARRGDRAQGARRGREREALADLRRPAVRQERLGPAGLRREQRRRRQPLPLDDDRHRIAAFGDVDRRGEQIGEGELAETLRQRHPARDRAGHGDRVPAAHGRPLRVAAVFLAEVLGRPRRRRPARGIEPMQLRSVPEDAERVRAEAVAARLDDRHHRRRGDRSIDGVAAALDHAEARLRRERVRGRDDVAREDRDARRRVARLPIEVHGATITGAAPARLREPSHSVAGPKPVDVVERDFALLADRRQGDDDDHERRRDEQGRRERTGDEGAPVAARQEQRSAQVLLHHRPEDEAEQERRRLDAELEEQVADEREDRRHVDVERAVVERVDADAAEQRDRREEEAVGHRQQLDPDADQRQVQDDEHQRCRPTSRRSAPRTAAGCWSSPAGRAGCP